MAISRNWANLRDFLRKSYNREVNEWFRDVPDPVPDNRTARKNAKRACLILPKESQSTALIKIQTFRFVVQRVHLRPHIYGAPIQDTEVIRKHRPQITLYFLEDFEDVDANYSQLDGQISYRLMNETSTSISKSELTSFGNRIKAQFGAVDGYVWRKGKDMASYTDWTNGYQFQLLVRNKSDAKEIIERVLATNQDNPDWKYLNYKENDEPTQAYPTIPSTKVILGKSVKEPRVRPICEVRFQYAYCSIWGLKEPVILYDKSFTYLDSLVSDVSL